MRWVVLAALLFALTAFPVSASALGIYEQKVHTSAETVGTAIRSAAHPSSALYGDPYYKGSLGWNGLKCADCHRGDLGKIHGGNCDTCHAGANPRASFTTWNKTCQQGACHPNTIVEDRWSGTVKTTITAFDHPLLLTTKRHAAPLAMTCTNCHNKTAKIQTLCTDTCHGVGTAKKHTPAEVTPTTLVSVHGQPHGAEYVAAGAYKGLKCTQCHSGDLSKIHADRCSVCHSAPVGQMPPRKSFTTWNKTCQQGACHPSTKITYGTTQVTAFAHPKLTTNTHKDAGVACSSCHVAGIRYENVCLVCHANGADPNKSHAPDQTVGASILGVHGGAPYGAPHPAAADWKPTCTGCHKGDLKTIHVKYGCATCHGTPTATAAEWAAGTAVPIRNSISGAWKGSCQEGACHPGTQITYGSTITVFKHKNSTASSHRDRGATCQDCHYTGANYRTFCFDCHGK